MAKKENILMFELCDRKPSGFIMDGSAEAGMKTYIDAPELSWIPNEGFMAVEKENEDGTKYIENVAIRFLENDRSIFLEDQKKRNVLFNKKGNKLMMEKGLMTIVETPSTASRFEYYKNVFYNEDAPNRPQGLQPLFRLVKLDQKAEVINEYNAIINEAKAIIYALQKKTKDGYEYNSEKIQSLCKMFSVYAEQDSQKITALAYAAEARPREFLELVTVFENTITTEVAHALELKVIEFDNNVAQYVDGNKIIKALGTEKLNKKQQIERLADFLKTTEGNEHLTELRAKLEVSKTNALK